MNEIFVKLSDRLFRTYIRLAEFFFRSDVYESGVYYGINPFRYGSKGFLHVLDIINANKLNWTETLICFDYDNTLLFENQQITKLNGDSNTTTVLNTIRNNNGHMVVISARPCLHNNEGMTYLVKSMKNIGILEYFTTDTSNKIDSVGLPNSTTMCNKDQIYLPGYNKDLAIEHIIRNLKGIRNVIFIDDNMTNLYRVKKHITAIYPEFKLFLMCPDVISRDKIEDMDYNRSELVKELIQLD